MFTIETFIDSIIQNIEDAIALFDGATIDACTEIADKAVEIIAKNAPYDEEPNNDVIPGEEGHLNESFYALEGISTGNGEAEAAVKTMEPIKLQYVTEGTDTPITPIIKQAMWWPTAEHPVALVSGQEPNPFVDESIPEIEAEVVPIVEDIFTPIFQSMGL